MTKAAGKKFKLRLEVTDPNKEDVGWSAIAIATVTKDGDPQEDIEVQFYLDGAAIDEPAKTVGDGRVTKEFVALKKGNRFFEAKMVDGPASASVRKTIKEESPKKAAKLLVQMPMVGDTREITLQVLAEDNAPIKNAEVVVIDLDDPAFREKAKTGQNGSTTVSIALTKPKTRLEFTVLGSSVVEHRKLYR